MNLRPALFGSSRRPATATASRRSRGLKRRPRLFDSLERRDLLAPVTATIFEYPVPTPSSQPNGIASGPDGALWFTELNTNRIGRVDVDGNITEFVLPSPNNRPLLITEGPLVGGVRDPNLYFTSLGTNEIGRITTAGVVTEFTVPTANSQPFGITEGPDNAIWFTENTGDNIGRFDLVTNTFTEFAIPGVDNFPNSIVVGSDLNLWFTATGTNRIGRVTPAGVFTFFDVPTPDSGLNTITTGPDGNMYFTEFSAGKIGRITPTGAITEFNIPGGRDGANLPPDTTVRPLGISPGADGAVYFIEFGSNLVGRFDPATQQFTEFFIPTANSSSAFVAAGPDGHIWFTEFGANQIGEFELPASTVQFSSPTYSVGENGGSATITITRTGSTLPGATVTFSTSDGTATSPADYAATTVTVVFGTGETSRTVTVPIVADGVAEGLETVNLTLSNPMNATTLGTPAAAVLNIVDFLTPGPRNLSINDVTVVEGNNAVFTVSLDGVSELPVTVDFTTADGTATAPADYATTAGTLTFAPGVTTQTITVPIVNDNLAEPAETFTVTLGGATNALISDPQGIGTILDDADNPVIADGTTITGVEGQSITRLVATFVDPGGARPTTDYTATIDWGDGTPTTTGVITFAGGTFLVRGTHTYENPGTYQVTTTIVEAGVGTAIANGQAVISDAALTTTGQAVTATVGTPILGVTVATGIDTGGPEDVSEFHALINWGDGSASSIGRVVLGAIVPGGPATLSVLGDHTFASAGVFNGTVTVIAADGAETTVPFTSTAFAPALTCAPIAVAEDVLLNNVIVATLSAGGGPAPVGNFYSATVDFGDGTAPVAGFVDAGGVIRASHLYAESGNYTIRVTVGAEGNPNVVTATCPVAVADVPIVLTGTLDPGSDSGLSNVDCITNDNTPTFIGGSEPGSVVQVFIAGLATPIAAGVTDAAGRFAVTSNVALFDGAYAVTFQAVDRNGVTMATSALACPLVIDTVGPRVTDLVFDRLNGRLGVAFQDERSGLDQRTLIDGSNYRFTGRAIHTPRPGNFVITGLAASPATGPTAAQSVTVTINGGRQIRGGNYRFTVFSGGPTDNRGIRDVAGNALDGEFFGFFPSGNNQRGGDFVAGIRAIHRVIFSPIPVQEGFATPLNPPGRPGSSFRIGNGTQANRTQQQAQRTQTAPRVNARLAQVQQARKAPIQN